MGKGYGARVFLLLCTLLLLLPAVCSGGTFDCDACGASGEPKAKRLNDETINGAAGYWVEYVCPKCGARVPGMQKKWVKTGSSKPKATATPAAKPPADPPAPPETKVPAAPQNTKKKQAPATAAPANPPASRPGKSAGNTPAPDSRNLEKYPFFSAAYPFRRLDGEGDPEAQAPAAGIQIWPESEGTSPLMRMLGN